MNIKEELINAEAKVDSLATKMTTVNELAWDAAVSRDKVLLASLQTQSNLLLDEYDLAYAHYQSLIKQAQMEH